MDVLNPQSKLIQQGLNESEHRYFLLWSASVLRLACLVLQATDVADADARGIVTLAMCALLTEGTTLENRAILGDDVMISNVSPATICNMPTLDVGHCNILTFKSGRAVQYDFIYWPLYCLFHFLANFEGVLQCG